MQSEQGTPETGAEGVINAPVLARHCPEIQAALDGRAAG